MAPGTGSNYKNCNHDVATSDNVMATVKHEAPTVIIIGHEAATIKCINLMCSDNGNEQGSAAWSDTSMPFIPAVNLTGDKVNALTPNNDDSQLMPVHTASNWVDPHGVWRKIILPAAADHVNTIAGVETNNDNEDSAPNNVPECTKDSNQNPSTGNKTMQGAAATSNAAGHMEVNQMHESEAAIVKDMANDETAYSNKVALKAPKGGGSVNTYTKMADSKSKQNLCSAHTAGGGYKWNHPVWDRVWHNPANMISLEECPNTGDHNAMEYDLLVNTGVCGAHGAMTIADCNVMRGYDRTKWNSTEVDSTPAVNLATEEDTAFALCNAPSPNENTLMAIPDHEACSHATSKWPANADEVNNIAGVMHGNVNDDNKDNGNNEDSGHEGMSKVRHEDSGLQDGCLQDGCLHIDGKEGSSKGMPKAKVQKVEYIKETCGKEGALSDENELGAPKTSGNQGNGYGNMQDKTAPNISLGINEPGDPNCGELSTAPNAVDWNVMMIDETAPDATGDTPPVFSPKVREWGAKAQEWGMKVRACIPKMQE
jgi:hypothetical protein